MPSISSAPARHGHVAAVLGARRRLHLDRLIDSACLPPTRFGGAMIAARILEPASAWPPRAPCTPIPSAALWELPHLAPPTWGCQPDISTLRK